jgi:hypothetical protein
LRNHVAHSGVSPAEDPAASDDFTVTLVVGQR